MDVDRHLATHDGVITRDEARRCGLGEDAIGRRLAGGAWLRRAPAVYFATAWPWTPAAHVRVAAEWAGPKGGALAATAAAWWLGVEIASPHPIAVLLPRGRGGSVPSGVTVTGRDPGPDRVRHRGLWVVRRPWAVLDAAVALGPGGPAFLDRALQRHVRLDDLRAVQSRHLARKGSATAGRLIARAGDRAASEPERRLIAVLRGAGIRGWVVNLPVTLTSGRRVVVDIAFADLQFAIEVDGWAHHVDHDRFVGDRGRKRAMVADGWTVIEVTWDDLEHRPEQVVAEIRAALIRLAA